MQTRKNATRFLAMLLLPVFLLSACGKQQDQQTPEPSGQEVVNPQGPSESENPSNQQEGPEENLPTGTEGETQPTSPASPDHSDEGEENVFDAPEEGDSNPVQTNLTDFTSAQADLIWVDQDAGTVTVGNSHGDHFAVFNGLTAPTDSFVLEADVTLLEASEPGGGISGALVFGMENRDQPSWKWYGANFDTGRSDPTKFRVFGPGFETSTDGQQGDIDFTKPLHLRLDVRRSGAYQYSFGNVGEEPTRFLTGVLSHWEGGYVGVLSFNSKVQFSNITFQNRNIATEGDTAAGKENVFDAPEEGDSNPVQTNLTDFASALTDLIWVDQDAGTVTVGNSHGDHFAVFNGLAAPTDSFVFEADVTLLEASEPGGGISGALVFGMETRELPNWKWYGANFDTGRSDPTKFRVFGPGFETHTDGQQGDIDFTKPLHLRLDVRRSGAYQYSFGNVGEEPTRFLTGVLSHWEGGYVGVLSFNSKVQFSNITLQDRSIAAGGDTAAATIDGTGFDTNLSGLTAYGGTWTVDENGLTANAADGQNGFAYSGTSGTDFVFSADVTFTGGGAASLLFRNQSTSNHSNAFALTLDSESARFMRWDNDRKCQLTGDKNVGRADKYTLKVVALGSWMSCYVNDVLVASSGDYRLGFSGQNTVPENGYFGLACSGGTVVFQNAKYTEITDDNSPLLADIAVTSSGEVEKKPQFFPTSPIHIQYVKNSAEKIDMNVTPTSSGAVITVIGPDGIVYKDGKEIPVKVGDNYVVVNSVTTASDGTEIPVTYRMNVFRRQAESIYYNEPYRDQYHYSVKDGWGNDPNGLIYYNGTYHLFHQYTTATTWSTMHWLHATSTDLVHWEEQPITFVPDAYGVEFSGCIVADVTNTSGLFSTKKGGLVAIITADGGGQRMQVAYSEDEGATWTKLNKIALDWANDPLHDQAFRDPKVFRWEGKWFLVVAGGPLRIYSSENLIDWTVESTYPALHTECPDLYPVVASDGAIKWVLSRGGRSYKIGDFKEVDGKWTYMPDAAYADADGVMNFGRDSYAAMTYYIQDFGTAAKPAIPEIMEINWMNTWDYCNEVAKTVGQNFNGTYNLILKVGAAVEDGKYVLTQNPVDAYESLRGEKVVDLTGVQVGSDNDVLSGFQGDCYEIAAVFTPGENTTKVGFWLRSNEDKGTEVSYNLATGVLFIDRGKSGIQVGSFANGGHQAVTRNADGTIDLHIFVDRASIEVFAMGGVAAGADMIFPAADSLGASVLVDGDPVTADITIYTLDSIWH